jgi:hypothetical protein
MLYASKNSMDSTISFEPTGTELIMIGKATFGNSPLGGGDAGYAASFGCYIDGERGGWGERISEGNFESIWKGKERSGAGNLHSFLFDFSIEGLPKVGEMPLESVAIDAVWYLPSLGAKPSEDPEYMVVYENDDPHIHYTSGKWTILQEGGVFARNASATSEGGASVTVLFNGNGLPPFYTKLHGS